MARLVTPSQAIRVTHSFPGPGPEALGRVAGLQVLLRHQAIPATGAAAARLKLVPRPSSGY